MRRTTLFIIGLLTSFITTFAANDASLGEKSFNSDLFPFERNILIYMPSDYDRNTGTEYDVVYVFDSQWRSRFDLVHSLLHYNVQSPTEDTMDFIVVGIQSPIAPIDEYQYFRNNDMLPVPEHQQMQSPYYGSSDKFKRFIKDEVMAYIDSTYRTSGHTLAIGHSLGASFILDALATDDLFDDYIALSPNFEWDQRRFAKGFMNYDFNNGKPHYIFLSMADESEETGWGKEWRDAWDMVKNFADTTTFPSNIRIRTNETPDYSHNSSYLPALLDCLTEYALYRHDWTPVDTTLHPVHIVLDAPAITGDVYITGNQAALADWNPQGIRMEKTGDTTYSIELNLRLPAEFKFTQGTWESQITPTNAVVGNLRISRPDNAAKHFTTR
ncbi:MAG: alpha/beta hydrolase-fold protein [Pseudoflavonifractor sp.]|nr:alpha/beta hydrolase-fold protein [Pseudoflavonifractor sp.]